MAAVAVAAGCSSTGDDEVAVAPAPAPEAHVAQEAASAKTVELPPPWTPSASEPEPDAKVAASRLIQVLGTYEHGGGEVAATRRRLTAAGEEPAIADAAVALLDPGTPSRVEIVYPQLGGLEATEASVMVVARFATGDSTTVRTVDVRLARGATGWRPTAIAGVGGAPPAELRPTPAAEALLDDGKVQLPDSARWDLQSGLVDDRIVELVRRIATRHDVGVTVFGSGHPPNVFGSKHTSNHTVGRGVDIWAIDGVPVADQQMSSTVAGVVDMALEAGATEIGGPVDSDGPGGSVFTNTLHEDHLHLAFDR